MRLEVVHVIRIGARRSRSSQAWPGRDGDGDGDRTLPWAFQVEIRVSTRVDETTRRRCHRASKYPTAKEIVLAPPPTSFSCSRVITDPGLLQMIHQRHMEASPAMRGAGMSTGYTSHHPSECGVCLFAENHMGWNSSHSSIQSELPVGVATRSYEQSGRHLLKYLGTCA